MNGFSDMLDDALQSLRSAAEEDNTLKPSQIRGLAHDHATIMSNGSNLKDYFVAETKFIKAFLDEMLSRGMPGALLRKLRAINKSQRAIRAYEIGRRGSYTRITAPSTPDFPTREYRDFLWDRIVYLCEDGFLREQDIPLYKEEPLHNLIVGDELEIGRFIYLESVGYDERIGMHPVFIRSGFQKMNIKKVLIDIATENILNLNSYYRNLNKSEARN